MSTRLLSTCAAENNSADSHFQMFPVAYMNITPDRAEVGFVQLLAVSTNVSAIAIQVTTFIGRVCCLTFIYSLRTSGAKRS